MDCRGGEEYREEDQWGGGPPHKSLGKGKGMGMKMNYLSLVLSPSKQAHRRGVDSTAKGSKIGMPIGTFIICPRGRCARYVYELTMLLGYAMRLSYGRLSYQSKTSFFMEGPMEKARNLSTFRDLFIDFSGLQINCAK